jgi:hypothetical protein
MIGLNSQAEYLPMMLIGYLMDKLLQTLCYGTLQDLPPSLGAPDDMIDDEMYRMLLMLLVHVATIQPTERKGKRWGTSSPT